MESDDAIKNESLTSVLGEVASTAKELFKSELTLLEKQFLASVERLSRDAKQFTLFACLTLLSGFPILASAVIGLGILLDGRYWLSSLIVGVICLVMSAFMVSRTLKKIKHDELKINAEKAKIKKASDVVKNKMGEVTQAIQGGI